MKSNKTDNNNKVCFINGRGYKMAGLKNFQLELRILKNCGRKISII